MAAPQPLKSSYLTRQSGTDRIAPSHHGPIRLIHTCTLSLRYPPTDFSVTANRHTTPVYLNICPLYSILPCRVVLESSRLPIRDSSFPPNPDPALLYRYRT